MAILANHISTFNDTAKVLLLSQGQTEAKDLLSKVAFIHDNLPEYLRLETQRDNREVIQFKTNKAEIQALPSTEKAGHGFQGSLIVRDEVARHEYARENYRAVARAVSAGGKLIELSTANKSDLDNYFQQKTEAFYLDPATVRKVYESGVELYTNPKQPGVCLVFLSWKLRPTRHEGLSLEEWWDSRIVPRYSKLEIEEQFPSCITDVFRPSLTKAYFDTESLNEMAYDVCQPIRQSEIDTHNSLVRVYKPPVKGRQYVMFTDPSDGVEDPFVMGIMDYVTGEVVCSATGTEKIDIVAKLHDEFVRIYNNARNSYEYTGSVGGAMAMCLDMLQTPNQAPRYKPENKMDLEKRGQWVSKDMKDENMGYLHYCLTKRRIVIHDSEFYQQAKLVQRDSDGKPVTKRENTYDWVMMMSGLCLLQKHSPLSTNYGIQTYEARGGKWQLANKR